MNRKKIRIIVAGLLAVVFVVSAVMLVRQEIQHRKTLADSDEAARLAGLEMDGEDAPRPVPLGKTEEREPQPEDGPEEPAIELLPAEALPEEALPLAWVDLGALREVNGDVVGWLSIPGTIVTYPLVQGEDNQFYLSHNWKKEYHGSGSVFLESTGSRDLTDFHTIVYGHNMRDGTMFGSLRNYGSLDYWRTYPSVYIVMDDMIYCYDIFAAGEAGVEEIVYRLDLEKKHLEEEFLQYCLEHSVIDTGLTPEASGNRFLTLSTCTGTGFYTTRWVIHGVLARAYIRPEI